MSGEDFVIRQSLDLPGMLEAHVTEIVLSDDDVLERRNVTDARCDFCLELLPRWQVPCEDFVFPGTSEGSTGPWGACDGCADLVRKGDAEALVLRSLIPATGLPQDEIEAYREAITFAQSYFWRFKSGDPEPWTDE